MEDSKIVELFWDRNEMAITATDAKYGKYCTSIANNILRNIEDAKECVNDTYINAWNSLPPHRPAILSTFLGKITRNISFNRYKHDHAEKRGGGEIAIILDELAECVSGRDSVEGELEQKELIQSINEFLMTLPEKKRSFFVLRYWYAHSVTDIAKDFDASPGTVAKDLERTRSKLKEYLLARGYNL